MNLYCKITALLLLLSFPGFIRGETTDTLKHFHLSFDKGKYALRLADIRLITPMTRLVRLNPLVKVKIICPLTDPVTDSASFSLTRERIDHLRNFLLCRGVDNKNIVVENASEIDRISYQLISKTINKEGLDIIVSGIMTVLPDHLSTAELAAIVTMVEDNTLVHGEEGIKIQLNAGYFAPNRIRDYRIYIDALINNEEIMAKGYTTLTVNDDLMVAACIFELNISPLKECLPLMNKPDSMMVLVPVSTIGLAPENLVVAIAVKNKDRRMKWKETRIRLSVSEYNGIPHYFFSVGQAGAYSLLYRPSTAYASIRVKKMRSYRLAVYYDNRNSVCFLTANNVEEIRVPVIPSDTTATLTLQVRGKQGRWFHITDIPIAALKYNRRKQIYSLDRNLLQTGPLPFSRKKDMNAFVSRERF
ncbi:MAG: hypothetical protein NTU44_01815 [Bacteroidetes bacterium]|nr:hypothetical protein [Bacteroidota bacterium]